MSLQQETGQIFGTEPSASAITPAGPWRRLFARTIDTWVIGMLLGMGVAFAIALVSPTFGLWIQKPSSQYLYGWLLTPLVFAAEGGVFSMTGTTLGKWLLGIRVLTPDGQRPHGKQYLKRLWGLYWFGYGAGIPFVALFTMIRQYRLLKQGLAASYDAGAFVVHAPRLTVLRGTMVTACILVMVAINGALQQGDRESNKSYIKGGEWTNTVTGRKVDLPKGWTRQEQTNDGDQAVHVFMAPDLGVYMVFAGEEIPADISLHDYADLWLKAVGSDMSLYISTETPSFAGEPAAVLMGNMVKDKNSRINATLIREGARIWRVVIVGATVQHSPTQAEALAMRDLLLSSIRPG